MRDKRKEILKDLLREFGSDEDNEHLDEKIYEKHVSNTENIPEKLDDSYYDHGYNLDEIIGNESIVEKVSDEFKRPPKKIKKMTEGIKAEIIEEGIIPSYNVNVPKFTEHERQLINEVREKLVEVAVSQVKASKLMRVHL